MIHNVPEQRLEPPHEEPFSDEPYPFEDMEAYEEEVWACGLTDEQLNDIYRRLGL
jgi:hypothetical protein